VQGTGGTPNPKTGNATQPGGGVKGRSEIATVARRMIGSDTVAVDTTDMLFICAGTFARLGQADLNRLPADHLSTAPPAGAHTMLRRPDPQDLVDYGLLPALTAQLPIVTMLEPHDAASLRRVLTEPVDAPIRQYQRLFEMEGTELHVEDGALSAIARAALTMGNGAWGLKPILERILTEPLFDLPDHKRLEKVVIGEEVVAGKASPRLIYFDG
jgi:ATP-dependent Clp protease ATP-binding subunit ClpX